MSSLLNMVVFPCCLPNMAIRGVSLDSCFPLGLGENVHQIRWLLMSWKLPDLFWLYVMMWNKILRGWMFGVFAAIPKDFSDILWSSFVIECWAASGAVKSMLFCFAFFSGSNGFSSDFMPDFFDGPSGLHGIQLEANNKKCPNVELMDCKMLEIGKSTNYDPPINWLSGIYHGKPLQNYKT